MSTVDVIVLTLAFFAGLVAGLLLGIICAKGKNSFYDDEGRK